MENYRVIEIKQSVFADNDQDANRLRQELKENKTFLLNLMSSPGSGKTTTLKQTISQAAIEKPSRPKTANRA
mgnify:CR=1 FL=1